jgi:hypothetical protein
MPESLPGTPFSQRNYPQLIREIHLEFVCCGRADELRHLGTIRLLCLLRRCSRFCDESGIFESANFIPSLEGIETRRGNGDCGTGQGLSRSWIASEALGFTRSRPHRLVYRSSSHHYGALVWDTAIRLSRNRGPGIDFARRCSRVARNTWLRIYCLTKTRSFGSSADVEEIPATVPAMWN